MNDPSPHWLAELGHFERTLQSHGLHPALRLLNARTSHRFTGVYRYDGALLRNVALVDRWNPDVTKGDDAPMAETFCAIVPSVGETLEVTDGPEDARFPWMVSNAVLSYCGALIRDPSGDPYGTLCHFDLARCEVSSTQLPLLAAATPLIYHALPRG
jgi:hypothetical protein